MGDRNPGLPDSMSSQGAGLEGGGGERHGSHTDPGRPGWVVAAGAEAAQTRASLGRLDLSSPGEALSAHVPSAVSGQSWEEVRTQGRGSEPDPCAALRGRGPEHLNPHLGFFEQN